VSSESVFKVLQTHPKDNQSFNSILASYNAPEDRNTYEKLAKLALEIPRYSFRLTMSALSKLLKKYWGKIVEDLIFEKPRRKSSAQSSKSNDSKGEIRNRLCSMDDQEVFDSEGHLNVEHKDESVR